MKPATKEEFKIAINNTPLFIIDRGNAPALYEKEVNVLIENLYNYCEKFLRIPCAPEEWLKDFGLEFLETCRSCIKAFKPKMGAFLPYFLSSLRRKYRTVKGRESAAKRHGHILSGDTEKQIYKLIRFADKKGIDLDDPAAADKIAAFMGTTPKKVAALLQMNESIVVSDTVVDGEGEENSIFDFLVDKQADIESSIDQEEALQELLCQCERTFLSLQERSRRAVSMALTAELLRAFKGDPKRVKALVAGRKFLSDEVLERYFAAVEEFEITKDSSKLEKWSMTRREIAALCGISEQSLSATWSNTFLTKLKKAREEAEE